MKRVTKETNVMVSMNLDGSGVAQNDTGIPFLDHMLDVSTFNLTYVSVREFDLVTLVFLFLLFIYFFL